MSRAFAARGGTVLWPLSGLGMDALPQWIIGIILSLEIGVRLAVIGIIPGNRRPNTAMAWLLAIFFIPAVALPLFLLIGNNKLSARRQNRQRLINETLLEATSHMELSDQLREHDVQLRRTIVLNRNLGAFPIQEGNRLELISDYRASMDWMIEHVDSATEYVHVLFYIIGNDDDYAGPVLDALERAAQRGVVVRVLFDHLGTARVRGYRDLRRRLDRSGIEWHRVLPVRPLRRRFSRLDLRNHRKILVVDGRIALAGSINLIEPHYQRPSARRIGRRWVDLNVAVTGPAVTSLDIVFASDWYAETGEDLGGALAIDIEADEAASGGSMVQVVPSGPGYVEENNLLLFNDLIYQATERIIICTPYLVPDDSLLYAVTTAARSGIDVTVLVSRKADQFTVHHAQQSYYKSLLEAGVRILRYPDPDVLHSKFMIIDDDVAVLGSSNMDMRSFSLNLEVTLMIVGEDRVGEIEDVFRRYSAISRELSLQEWLNRPLMERYLDNVFRLTSALQ